jgi:uncharacterized protein YkwD
VFIELLEQRRFLTASVPTNNEQYLLELINRARGNPTAEATLYGIALNEGLAAGTITTDAKQPLAFNTFLVNAARGHSQDMINHDYFAHQGFDGTQPQDRMAASGYFFDPLKSRGSGENIAYRSTYPSVPNQTTTTAQIHEDLFVDSGIAGRGHRTNIMNPSFKEIGTGVVSGVYTSGGYDYNAVMATEDFAYVLPSAFLTGVVYSDDVTADNFYTPGEGIGSVTIAATRVSDSAVFTTTTFSTGGYALSLAAGTYTVTASGGTLTSAITFQNVVIGTDNVKRDFVPSAPAPDTTAPTAVAAATDVVASGGTSKTFTVTYSDDVAIDVSTIDSSDVRVTGPNAFSQTATLISVNSNSDGTPRTGTYSITAPGGTWDLGDNGTYTITMRANQVKDSSANAVASGALATFAVSIPDVTAPTAALSVSNIAVGGATTKTFTVTYSDDVAINISSLDSADIQVTGPNAFSQMATFVSADVNSNGTPRVATYRIDAPGGSWDVGDNGTYTITLEASQVADTSGNSVAAGALGAFAVNIGDTTAPTAVASATDVTTAGTTPETFTVTYSDDVAVDVASLDSTDVLVTGPQGFSQLATLVNVNTNSNGTPRVATYSVAPPGGAWDPLDSGAYTIAVQASQVMDTGGNSVAAGTLGTFQVNIPDTTAPTAAASVSGVTAGGTTATITVTYSDDVAIDVGTLDSSDIQVTGPNGFSQTATFLNENTGSNGSPRVATYRIDAPGGAWDAADDGTYTVEMQAGQVADTSGNFVATATLGTFSSTITDTNAPTGSLSAKGVKTAGATSYTFKITYTDEHAVNALTIGAGDVQVTGPHSFKQNVKFVSKSSSNNLGSITATYKITPPGGRWDAADNGTYSVVMRSGQVTDTSSNAVAAGKMGTFKVNILHAAAARLAAVVDDFMVGALVVAPEHGSIADLFNADRRILA